MDTPDFHKLSWFLTCFSGTLVELDIVPRRWYISDIRAALYLRLSYG